MKFLYEEHSLKPGIYKILNAHTNRIYIGQSSRFKKRWYEHQRNFLNNKHQNEFLRNDFNKCFSELGHDDFLEFHVLEVMEGSTKEERNKREEEWIAKFWDKQQTCYNFKKQVTAKIRQGTSKWKQPMSDESKTKIGLGRKNYLKANPQSMSSTIEGRKRWCNSNREKLHAITLLAGQNSAKKRALTITLKNPLGNLITISNVAKFARENQLQPDYLMMVWKGTRSFYKGWTKPI